MFGKRHADIIRAIQLLDCSEEFSERNFALSIYQSKSGKNTTRNLPQYELTKDGFTFLAMGFTGAKAAKFKEQYIAEFNRMANLLNKQAPQLELTRRELLVLALEAEDKQEGNFSLYSYQPVGAKRSFPAIQLIDCSEEFIESNFGLYSHRPAVTIRKLEDEHNFALVKYSTLNVFTLGLPFILN